MSTGSMTDVCDSHRWLIGLGSWSYTVVTLVLMLEPLVAIVVVSKWDTRLRWCRPWVVVPVVAHLLAWLRYFRDGPVQRR